MPNGIYPRTRHCRTCGSNAHYTSAGVAAGGGRWAAVTRDTSREPRRRNDGD
jgi:hypothetical protein